MVSSVDASQAGPTDSSGLYSPPKSVMANAINTLLSLRDSVRIKAPWSPQSSGALNLGLLSNAGSLLPDIDASPPRISHSTKGGKILQDSINLPSPRGSPQRGNSISPSRSNSGNHNSYSCYSNGINGDDVLTLAEILDELAYLYPQEDFTLLRNACMKNEITLTKLSRGFGYGYPTATTPSPTSGQNSNGTGNNEPFKDDFMTQQTLQLIKQQNEYVQMLQHSGVNLPVFQSDMTMADGLNLSSVPDSQNSKYPAWFQQLAQSASAVGVTLPAANGNGTTLNSKKTNGDHLFLSPKTPASSSTKPKTVAAALAASRHSPNMMNNVIVNGKCKKPALPRKRQQRPKPSTITRPTLNMLSEDFVDPSSMVEATISASPEYGIDLSTMNNNNNDYPSSKRSKTEPLELPPMSSPGSSSSNANGHNLLNAASLSLENYLRNVLPGKKLPHNTPEVQSPALSESDKAKQQVLDAYIEDPEVAGDARGVARKFGLNIRVVLKWLREGPSKSLPAFPTTAGKTNGGINSLLDSGMIAGLNLHFSSEHADLLTTGDGRDSGSVSSVNHIRKKNLPNRRKNTKPNQICDFPNDDLPDDPDTTPLDMVVPIKKRRVSDSSSS